MLAFRAADVLLVHHFHAVWWEPVWQVQFREDETLGTAANASRVLPESPQSARGFAEGWWDSHGKVDSGFDSIECELDHGAGQEQWARKICS